ncbi:MAG: glycosyltransferase family 2 protein [Candidatus Omnitrophica bacterium]|nr:glycosyltransferase family 2 protein [Candidatus Omnitrophota bacterium]
MPTCSILLPTYQAGAFIGRAIEGVLAQQETDWELLIGDNASQDETARVVSRFQDPRVRYLRRPHNVGYVRNVRQMLAEEARGEYAVILCADDWWEAAYLHTALAVCAQDPTVGWVHTAFRFQDDAAQTARAHVMTDCPRVMEGRAFHERFFFGGGMLVALSSVLFRRDWALQAEAFQQEVFHTDTALWLKLACLGRVGYCPAPLVTYRWRSDNLSNTTARARRLEEWIDALTGVLAFARRQGLASNPAWERAVMARTLTWCLKDAPNVKIASGSNREVARVVRKVYRTAPRVFLHPGVLTRVALAFSAPPGPLAMLRRWRNYGRPSDSFQLPLDHLASTT